MPDEETATRQMSTEEGYQELSQEFYPEGMVRPEGEPPQEWAAYIHFLEAVKTHLEEALQETPGAEARGVAWMDVYGSVSIGNQRKPVKISITSRSDVGPGHALQGLMISLQEAKAKNLRPYNF